MEAQSPVIIRLAQVRAQRSHRSSLLPVCRSSTTMPAVS
jgi:hypothetical protein